ncbi:hypothetical protein FF36_02057 [Frankia torreyi]|uniref:Lipoprotein n=1 Tax=Frankia torreyi TaxID=1856 RepID=A0A0D8BH47_9ACTN|nr:MULTISPECIES: hypothetical protein [Frankia]KJE23608.1 hypothetical protein FF36_02057 [Frankia torreyi]KQC37289.1 hypothetical protein UK82_16345 [Frankia sp. ACN1ag]KQM05913.1 hypothetical protein FF86_101281 [Frankia sp. CpI1-P]
MRARPRCGAIGRTLLGLGLLLALGAAAACGGGGEKTNGLEKLPAAEVGSRALTALRSAPGVHVVGSEEDPSSDSPGRYDLVMSATTTRGTIEEYGQRTQLVKINNDTYVRRGRSFYTATGDGDAADLLADRWVRLAPADAAKYSYFTLGKLSDSLGSYLVGLTGDVRREKVGDARTVRAAAPDGTAFVVANTGPTYPLRITVAGSSTNQMTFDDFGPTAAVTPPGSAVDLSSLG